jgi:hypothetical protein
VKAKNTKRIMGTHTASTVLPEGQIEVAPMHCDTWRDLNAREIAARALLINVQEFYIETIRLLSLDRGNWFSRVGRDLFDRDINIEPGWSFDGKYLIPSKISKEKAPPPEQPVKQDQK